MPTNAAAFRVALAPPVAMSEARLELMGASLDPVRRPVQGERARTPLEPLLILRMPAGRTGESRTQLPAHQNRGNDVDSDAGQDPQGLPAGDARERESLGRDALEGGHAVPHGHSRQAEGAHRPSRAELQLG